jgi:hypothetical protein
VARFFRSVSRSVGCFALSSVFAPDFLPGPGRSVRSLGAFRPSSGAFGSVACSLNSPCDPTGRRSTVPGAAIAASTAFGSSVSSAKPRLKTSGSAPHASAAAFIEGAATASSKNPPAVVR